MINTVRPLSTPITLARYPELTQYRLCALAERGVAVLRITQGTRAEAQANILKDAKQRFLNKAITAESYRKRTVMILNYCRNIIEQTWEGSPEVKPAVTSFLRRCVQCQSI